MSVSRSLVVALFAFALSACEKAPIATIPTEDAAAATTTTADPIAEVPDGAHIADAAGAPPPTALPTGRPLERVPPRHRPAPTNCGQHPEQPGCNCFSSHPNSTCADP